MLKKHKLIPTIAWGFFIYYLTLKPKSTQGNILPEWLENLHPDKIAHFGFWALWYLIYYKTFIVSQNHNAVHNVKPQRSFLNFNQFKLDHIFIIVAICNGAIIEGLQYWLNWGRSAEWLDLLCDSMGVIFTFICLNSRWIKTK